MVGGWAMGGSGVGIGAVAIREGCHDGCYCLALGLAELELCWRCTLYWVSKKQKT